MLDDVAWRRRVRRATAGVVLLTLNGLAGGASAQDAYPSRTVTVVVPQAAGGTNDIVARLVADKMGEVLGASRFVVENRVGAGGNIGTASTARAAPDGYTLLVTVSSSQAINPALYARTNFDPIRDFEPITMLARVPNVLVAHPSLPVSSMAELIALAKKESAEPLQYGSAGNGTLNHLLGEMLKARAGIKLVHVPYRGVGPMLNDMLGGQVKLGFASLPSVISHLNGRTLKPLGVSSTTRDPAIPDVPAIADTLPGYAGDLWVALFAPRGLPADLRDKLRAAAHTALADASVRAKFAAQGAAIETSSPDELATILKADLVKWAEVVREAGAKVE